MSNKKKIHRLQVQMANGKINGQVQGDPKELIYAIVECMRSDKTFATLISVAATVYLEDIQMQSPDSNEQISAINKENND